MKTQIGDTKMFGTNEFAIVGKWESLWGEFLFPINKASFFLAVKVPLVWIQKQFGQRRLKLYTGKQPKNTKAHPNILQTDSTSQHSAQIWKSPNI